MVSARELPAQALCRLPAASRSDLARPWPIPFHPHCQCEQLEVPPGQAPIPFRTAGGLAAAMPVGGQVELVGPLNWLIRSAGLVSWDDLFDAGGDPRDFDQVVKRKGLTVEQLVKAGVAEGVARRAVGLGWGSEAQGGSQGKKRGIKAATD